MNVEEIMKAEVVDTIKLIDYLSDLKQEDIQKIIIFTKNVKGTHSDKWSQIYDFLLKNDYNTNFVTKILQLLEFDCMNSLINILTV